VPDNGSSKTYLSFLGRRLEMAFGSHEELGVMRRHECMSR